MQDLMAAPTPYGELHDVEVRPGVKVSFIRPAALMYSAVKTCPAFSLLMNKTIASTSPHPLQLIIYTDEVTLGNQLSYRNRWKTWALYYTVQQFGNAVISDGDFHAQTYCN